MPVLKKLEGLEDLPRMVRIAAPGNKLTSLEVAKMPKLLSVVMRGNQLTTLSVQNMPKFESIDASKNKLTTVALSGLPALSTLGLDNNKLTAIPHVALLFYGLSTTSYRGTYVPPARTSSGSSGRRGGSRGIRYRGSRYSRGGGYRSSK